jgi:hypothetical protein
MDFSCSRDDDADDGDDDDDDDDNDDDYDVNDADDDNNNVTIHFPFIKIQSFFYQILSTVMFMQHDL